MPTVNQDIHDIFTSYTHYHSPALKFQNGPGRYAGGVSVFIRLSCKLVVEQINVKYDNIIAVNFKQPFTHRQNDLILIAAYIPPTGSPYYRSKYNITQELNGIILLEQCIADIRQNHTETSLILTGDLNSRTGSIQGVHEEHDLNKYLNYDASLLYDDSIKTLARTSEDTHVNVFGRSLLNLCGVHEKSGSYTFMSW